VEDLSSIPGCKYSSVASATEFEASVATEFAYDVTPVAFNIEIELTPNLHGSSMSVAKAFGSPELHRIAPATTQVNICCEFASPMEGEISDPDKIRLAASQGQPPLPARTGAHSLLGAVGRQLRSWSASLPASLGFGAASSQRSEDSGGGGCVEHCGSGNVAGGILLLQLACTEPHGFTDAIGSFGTLVKTRWTDAHGRPHSHEELVTFRFSEGGWYSHPAIRKAMALVRYVDAQSEYILDDRDASENLESTARADPLQLASWRERHERYANQFESLRAELLGEMMVVGDASLEEVAGVAGSGSNRSVLQVSGPPPLLPTNMLANPTAHSADDRPYCRNGEGCHRQDRHSGIKSDSGARSLAEAKPSIEHAAARVFVSHLIGAHDRPCDDRRRPHVRARRNREVVCDGGHEKWQVSLSAHERVYQHQCRPERGAAQAHRRLRGTSAGFAAFKASETCRAIESGSACREGVQQST
jgi:hypothetical protein